MTGIDDVTSLSVAATVTNSTTVAAVQSATARVKANRHVRDRQDKKERQGTVEPAVEVATHREHDPGAESHAKGELRAPRRKAMRPTTG